MPLAHLDRPFDYAVPEKFADTVQAGCRVRVRFQRSAARRFVLSLDDATEFTELLPLSHVPSGEPVLTPQVARLARVVADRYAGTLGDVLRLALPPRRAAAEKRPTPTPEALPGRRTPASAGTRPAALLTALAEGRPARAVWTAAGGLADPAGRALPGRAVRTAGGAVVVPDGKDLDRLAAAAGRLLPEHSFTVLRADDSPEKRYRQFLAASRGAPRRWCWERGRRCSRRSATSVSSSSGTATTCTPTSTRLSARPRRPGPAGRLPRQLRRHRRCGCTPPRRPC